MAAFAPILKADGFFIGEDKVLQFPVKNAAGAVQAITGWALEWVLRTREAATTATITKTTASGIAITDGPGGICTVAVAAADTVNLQPGTYHHTLRRTGGGVAQVLAYGPVVLQLADTR